MSNKYLNKTYTNKQGLNYKIVHYNTYYDITILFDSGYIKSATMKEVKRNAIKDKLSPSVHGVGIVGIRYNTNVDGKHTTEYGTWKNMLRRCYSEKGRYKPQSYDDCTVSENFKKYSYFYEWVNTQVGFNSVDDMGNIFQLDKDLLSKGNKIYSENTCVFLPLEINSVLTKSTAKRGEYLIGVSWHKKDKAFRATVNRNKGHPEYLGSFKTELEAFNAYKQAKENYLKQLAEKWKDKIDDRAYEALMNYQVEITD